MKRRSTTTTEEGTSKKRFGFKDMKQLLRLFVYLRPHRLLWSVGFFFLLVTMGTSLLFPKLLGGLMSATPETLGTQLLMLFGVLAIQSVAGFFRLVIFVKVTEKALAELRTQLYNHLVRLPMAFFNAKRVGELNSRVASDTAQVGETLTTTFAEFLRMVSMVVGGILILAFTSIKLTLFIIAVIPPFMIVAIIFGRFIRRYSKKVQAELAESNTVVEETFQGIQTVKAFTNERFEGRRYADSIANVVKLAVTGGYYRGAFASFISFGIFAAIGAVIWFGVTMIHNGELAPEKLSEFILYAVFIGGSIGGLAGVYAQIQKTIGATEAIFGLLDEQPEGNGATSEAVPDWKSLRFEEVSFAYPSRSDLQVLDRVSFTLNAGKTLALVGQSGSGKSTIASLIMRFYQAEGGFSVDNTPVTELPLEGWRSQLAFVPQDVLLFGGSIRENITYGKTDATEEEILWAAREANALTFIEEFPEGLETTVGERGVQLSGGQRQRIAIARALLRNPKLLVLDEATSALDSNSEQLVQEALERLMKGRTSIVIAHRLSTVKNADQILVLDGGHVIERGSHEELLSVGGAYAEMVSLQDLGAGTPA